MQVTIGNLIKHENLLSHVNMAKKLYRLVILKIKNINLSAMKIQLF